MHISTIQDLGYHAGQQAAKAMSAVADLVDDLQERMVLQTYAASMVCATLIATAEEVAQRDHPDHKMSEAFVMDIMGMVSRLVAAGVMLGEKQMAQRAAGT